MSCPFCQPNVLKVTFAESENFWAIYNLSPVLPGHVLIVPKQHLCSFLDLDEILNVEMVVFSRKIIKTLQHAFNSKSFDWTIQDGKPAGQTVDHMHMHIIPRHDKDMPEPGDWYPALAENEFKLIDSFNRPKLNNEQLEKITKKLNADFIKLFPV
jgi:bis(5'-adenosyl)-triphosphatase